MQRIVLSLNSAVSWTLKILLFTAVVYMWLAEKEMLALFAGLSLVVSFIPAVVNHNYNTNLPWPIDFWLTLWVALSVAGELGLYGHYFWWDKFLHFGGTAVLAYLAFVIVYALNFTGKVRLSIPLIGFFTFMVAVAIGAIWEMLEFLSWRITGHDALAMHGNLVNGFWDTQYDLQFDFVGALVMSLVAMKHIARQRHIHLRQWMRPFGKIWGSKLKNARIRVRERKRELVRQLRARKKLKVKS